MDATTEARLEYLRGELRAERISYAELAELQGLADQIPADDIELREAAGIPEHDVERCACGRELDTNGEHDGGYGAWCG